MLRRTASPPASMACSITSAFSGDALSSALVADNDVFHAPSIGVGAVDLAPSLLADGDVFYAAYGGDVVEHPALPSRAGGMAGHGWTDHYRDQEKRKRRNLMRRKRSSKGK